MKTKLLTALLLAVTLALGTGCVAVVVGAAAGAGAVVYSGGNLKSKEYASYDKGWDAALAAMRDLNYAVVSQDKDAVSGKIVARAAGDKKIKVEVTKVSGTVVEFQIRVGTWGDKTHSLEIRDKIRKHL